MRSLVVPLSLILVQLACLAPETLPADQRALALTHVTVIDATGAPAQPDMTVVVSGSHIAALGKSGSIVIPEGAQVINATGQFVIPGLWDMHTHAFMRKNKILPLLTLYLYIANGVTGVRDMGDQGVEDDFGDFPYVNGFLWRQAISAGATLGPRLNLAGVIVDGPMPRRAGWASIHNEAEAREQVIFLKQLGADLIKPYDGLTREAYFALADEAKTQGLALAGHTPLAVSAAEVSDVGQRSIEHLTGILLACSSQEEQLSEAVRERGVRPNVEALLDSYSEDKARELFARFVKNGTYQVPTLVRGRLDRVPMSDPRIAKYFSPALRQEHAARVRNDPNPAADLERRLLYETHLRLVREMHDSGVKILAGTDTRLFGSDLHEELKQLVMAGLTPMAALQAATRNVAEYLGTLESMGTVEEGKLADLLLLDADPLESISNTQEIRAVIVNGRLLERDDLDRLLRQVQTAANDKTAQGASELP